MDSFLDECPICYTAYREPKGLPCFHTFCRECLQIHINNNAVDGVYFNCPMCRKRTLPFGDKRIPIHEWAKSFPTNNYILNRYVEISQKQCPTHRNELLDISCKTCHVMICCQCCLDTHQKCEKTLTKYNAKRIKNNLSASLQDLKVKMKPLENRLFKLEEDKESTEAKLRLMSEELAAFISNQERHWLEEIETAYLKESGALQEQKDNVDEIMTNIEENINDIDSFIGVEEENTGEENGPRIQGTYDYQPRHTLLSRKTDLDEFKVEVVNFQINKKFIKIKDAILKESMVERIPDPSKIIGMMGENGSPLFLRELRFFSETLFGINDMVTLPDHSVLITEACFKRIWKFSATGQCLRNVYFDTEPYGLCLLQDNCVAISQPDEKKINILDCGNLSENESFSFEKRYYGLASDDNKKIFSLYRDNNMCVDIISKNNPQSIYQIIHIVKLPTFVYMCDGYRLRVAPSSGDVIIINSTNSLNVACVDQSGAVVFNYEGESDNRLRSISDVAVSRNFIFVADKIANKIHRIRHEGSFVDIPLASNDGISDPRKIFVNNEGVLAVLSKTNQNPQIQLFSS